MKKFITGLIILVYTFALIYYSKEISAGIVNSVRICLTSILPSLYAFMVISGFIVSSDFYKLLGRPFGMIARYVFRIPEELFPIFLLSSAAGYPMGAKLLTDLYRQNKIERALAERMLGYCYMGGPAFFCGVAGTGIYGSVKIGMVIFLCVFISNVLTGFLAGLKNPFPAESRLRKTDVHFTLRDFIESINSGGVGIIKICAAIVFFASVTAILESSGILTGIAAAVHRISGINQSDCLTIIKSILEISNISSLSPDAVLLPTAAALLSFGGVCVIIQTEGIIAGELSTNIFYLYRIISVIISYFCCKIVIYSLDINEFIQVNSEIQIGYRQNSPIPSIFLLIMTILLLSNNYIVKSKKI